MLLRAVARVGDLVGLDDEAERVAEEERQHDRHQDHGGLLAPLPAVAESIVGCANMTKYCCKI